MDVYADNDSGSDEGDYDGEHQDEDHQDGGQEANVTQQSVFLHRLKRPMVFLTRGDETCAKVIAFFQELSLTKETDKRVKMIIEFHDFLVIEKEWVHSHPELSIDIKKMMIYLFYKENIPLQYQYMAIFGSEMPKLKVPPPSTN